MSYVGNTPTTQGFSPAIDYFNGTGSQTAFTCSRPIASVAQVVVVVNNVTQNPSTAYTVSGNTITFTGAPSVGTNNIYVSYTSPITQVIQPGQGTVGTAQLIDTAVTPAKLSAGAPTWDSSGNQTFAGNQTFGAAGSILAENNMRFKSAGDAYLDHNTVGKNINVRVSNASALDTNALQLLSTGVVSLPTGQLKFPATQSASTDANTLDDYEEGTWTPVLNFGGNDHDGTYSYQSASYVKVGQIVYVQGIVGLSSAGTRTGTAVFKGLPFTAYAQSGGAGGTQFGLYSGMSGINYAIQMDGPNNATASTMYTQTTTGYSLLTKANFGNSCFLQFGFCYRAAV